MRPFRVIVCVSVAFYSVAGGWTFPVCAQDDLITLITDLLGDKDKDLRALAFEQIRKEVPGEAATLKFAEFLTKLPPDGQVGLLSALADRGDTAAAPAVRSVLESTKEVPVKVAALEALSALGGPADMKLLAVTLARGSAAEQAAARRSLVQMTGEGISTGIAAQMNGAPAAQRVELIKILTERRARETLPDLLQAAVDNEATVRTAAMTALGQLAEEEQLPGMVQGVLHAERGRERDTAEKMVMIACLRMADGQDPSMPLLAATRVLPEDQQMLLLPTLGRVGGTAALAVVERAVGDANPAVHDIGIQSLCNWPVASIAPRLLLAARTDEHANHRRTALRALIRVAPLPDERSDQRRLDVLRTAIAMCEVDDDIHLSIERVKAIRTVETLRFLLPYLDEPPHAQPACLTIVELAHHSGLREAHRDEFHAALDKVISISQDPTVVDRAQRYKKGQTWVRPEASS